MGINPNDTVYVSYISDDTLKNRFRELLVSSFPLDELEQPSPVLIPTNLLEEANISENQDIEIACLDGAILIKREQLLWPDELEKLIQSMGIAADLSDLTPASYDAACDVLLETINSYEEEETHDGE